MQLGQGVRARGVGPVAPARGVAEQHPLTDAATQREPGPNHQPDGETAPARTYASRVISTFTYSFEP